MSNVIDCLSRGLILILCTQIPLLSAQQYEWDDDVIWGTWLTGMIESGAKHGDVLKNDEPVDPNLGYHGGKLASTYYDAMNAFATTMLLCDRLKGGENDCTNISAGLYSEERWASYVSAAFHVYMETYVIPNEFWHAGKWRFTEGLRQIPELKQRFPNLNFPEVTDYIMSQMRDRPAYSRLSEYTRNDVIWSIYPRDFSYAFESHINAEKFGLARDDVRVDLLLSSLAKKFEAWTSQTGAVDVDYTTLDEETDYDLTFSARVVKPFMTSLAAKALTEFYDWELQNGQLNKHEVTAKIPTLLADFYSFLYNDALVLMGNSTGDEINLHVGKRMWQQNAGVNKLGQPYGAFFYSDRDLIDPTSEKLTDRVYLAADLNLLIVPTYGWLARHYMQDFADTGNATSLKKSKDFLAAGDNIFMSGIHGRYIDRGKQYNQHYRWSAEYLDFRDQTIEIRQSLSPARIQHINASVSFGE